MTIKTLNKIILPTVLGVFLVVGSLSAQNVGDTNRYNNNNNNNNQNNSWGNNWNWGWNNNNLNNLPTQVYSFIEQKWSNNTTREQKINSLKKVVQLLNQKINDLERQNNGGGWGGGGNNNDNFSATPSSGRAPLSVTFLNNHSGQGGRATIDFGDGTTEAADNCYAPADRCLRPGRNTHVYRNTGTYTARLVQNLCPRGAQCLVAERVLGTEVIRVTR
jgi:hypothetical protein